MTEALYLIAHKVRGEAAFDVAQQIDCSLCTKSSRELVGCTECEGLGYWWIIPTSGHRAYPWWNARLSIYASIVDPNDPPVPTMPSPWRDHYEAKPDKAKTDRTPSLAHTLGLIKPFKRRI